MSLHSASEDQSAASRGFVLICGESGSGKTTMAGSAAAVPELSPVAVLSCDNSYKPLTGPHFKTLLEKQAKDYDVELPPIKLEVQRYDTTGDVASFVDGILRDTFVYRPTGEPFKTVVLDNLTQLHSRQLNELTGMQVAGVKPEWPHYMQSQMAMLTMLQLLTNKHGLHVIATVGQAGERPGKKPTYESDGFTPRTDVLGRPVLQEVSVSDAVGYRLDLAKQLADKVPYYFSIVARMYRLKGGRVFDARQHPLFPIGKDATESLVGLRPETDPRTQKKVYVKTPYVLWNATMIELYDCIRQAMTTTTD